jgi:hypothetical protein
MVSNTCITYWYLRNMTKSMGSVQSEPADEWWTTKDQEGGMMDQSSP